LGGVPLRLDLTETVTMIGQIDEQENSITTPRR
jgi:hypothetical protein